MVEIEERELLLTPEAPLRAWRLFRVRSQDNGFILSSPDVPRPRAAPVAGDRERSGLL